MQSQIKQKLLPLTIATVASFGFSNQAYAIGFTGAYDASNFTLTNSPALGNGSVDTTNAATGTITLIGGNDNSGNPSITDWTITVSPSGEGTISFDWSYFSLDTVGDDRAGYLVNGTFTELATVDGQSSTIPVTLNLLPTDIFGFRVESDTNISGAGEFTVSNFNFVPVPFEFSPIFGLATLGALAVIKKIRKS